MPQGLPVSRLINVTLNISPTAAQFENFDTALILGDSNVIDTNTRIRSYSSLSAVATDFGTTAPEYLAATLFFSQTPQPSQLYIGRWAKTATAAQLFGAPLTVSQQLLANWTAVTAGAFLVYEDGVPHNITGLNFSAQTNLNGVAGIIQTALASAEASSTVVWDAEFERFEFTSGTTGVNSLFSFLSTSRGVGHATISTNPSNGDTLTIQGTAIEFVTSGATGNEVNIGVDTAHTMANLLAFLGTTADSNLVLMTYSAISNVLYIVSKATGTTGNSYTLASNSADIVVSAGTLAGGSNGTDISGQLGGLSTSSGAYVAQGLAAETPVEAVGIFDNLATQWYALTFAATAYSSTDVLSPAQTLAVAAYIEGDADNPHLFGVTTGDGAAIVPGDTTSIGYQLNQLDYRRTFYQYSSSSLYAATSILGRGCTVNFAQSLSTITFMWKQEPGVVAESLNSTQADQLNLNRYNYFTAFNNSTSIIVNGMTPAGFIDETWDLDWFVNQMQADVYNTLYTLPKVPQTDAGENLLTNAINASCQAAVNNGTLAPGIWNGPGFGQLQTGDFLSKGFYVYQPPVSSQAQADREARKSVPFQVAVKLAGAVHTVAITVNVNR